MVSSYKCWFAEGKGSGNNIQSSKVGILSTFSVRYKKEEEVIGNLLTYTFAVQYTRLNSTFFIDFGHIVHNIVLLLPPI